MIINQNKTNQFFEANITDTYIEFLHNRKVISLSYIKALESGAYGFLMDNSIVIGKDEYSINYFLGASKDGIYDLIRDNQIYGISPQTGTIFAVLLGDDFLFFKPDDEAVYFCFRDTEEIIMVASDFDEFIKMI